MEIKESVFPDVHLVWDADVLIGINTDKEETRFSGNDLACYKKQLEKIVKAKLSPYLTKKGRENAKLWQDALGAENWTTAECLLSMITTNAEAENPVLDCDVADIAYLFTEECSIDDEDKLIHKYLYLYGVSVLMFNKANTLPHAAWDTDPVTKTEASARGLLFDANNKCVCLHFTKKMPETCVIPTSIDHVRITTITGHIGPIHRATVKKLVIPSTIERIEATAFSNCSSLTTVELSDGVKEIGNYAFFNCANLTSLKIPDSVETIGDSAFSRCHELSEITLPKQLKELNRFLFYYCDKLKYVCIPETVKTICEDSFSYCGIEYLEIPRNVEGISMPNFNYCYDLEGFSSKSPFYRVEDGRYLVSNADNQAIAFASCRCTETTIPASINLLDNALFKRNKTLQSIVFPKTLRSIVSCQDSHSLTSVRIEAPVTVLPYSYFMNCTNLKEIILPETLVEIRGEVFKRCVKLVHVDLPDSLTFIRNNAFCDSGLKNIDIPDSVKVLGEGTFYNCKNLERVTIGKGVKTLESSLFSNCESLVSVNFSDSVKRIDSRVFCCCYRLSIKIPDTVCKIGGDAFNFIRHLEYHGSLNTSSWKPNAFN